MTNVKDNLFSMNTEIYIIKVMLNRPDSIVEIAQKLHPDDFYYKPMRHLFGAIKRLSVQGDVTPDGIMTLLENENREGYEILKAAGGTSAIMTLIDNTLPHTPSVESHIETLKSFTYRRNAVDVADKLKTFVTTNIDTDKNRQFKDVSEIDDKIKELTYSLAESLGTKEEIKPIGSKIEEVKHMLLNKEMSGISISGLYPKFNGLIKQLRKKALYIFGAPEKTGKSTFMLDIAWYVARVLNIPVAYGDTEMSTEEQLLRIVSKESGVPEDNIVNNYERLNEKQMKDVEEAWKVIERAPFYHFNCNSLTNNELESKVKLLQLQYGIQLFVYDYLKLQAHEVEKGRLDMILAAKIDTLKEKIAKSCDIPVISSGQMRKDEKGNWKFWESSHFTKLADVIGVIARNTPNDSEVHLGTHHFELLMGRKVNSNDVGKTVDFMFEQNVHRIKEIG